ncbi:HAMP domain-containing sensor histidine kinase [Bacillus gobiensis]|uniref:sensor histidine kinase n=1 Tax=Bacillus gobiensis TaxID=1441095 RepID=UPI003D24BBA6
MNLTKKYVMLIVLSIFMLPLTYFGISLFLFFGVNFFAPDLHPSYDEKTVTESVNETTAEIAPNNKQQMMEQLKNEYPESTVSILASDGQLIKPNQKETEKWTPSQAAAETEKMKGSRDFMLLVPLKDDSVLYFRMDDSLFLNKWQRNSSLYAPVYFLFMLLAWAGFIYLSWLFFKRIKNRLIQLGKQMQLGTDKTIPAPVKIIQKDEIGELEHAFNEMIAELKASREQEQKESEIRRKLIADLSHDLRTPLTVMNAHAYKLQKEPLSLEGKKSLDIMTAKAASASQMMENLTYVALLHAHKIPMKPQKQDLSKLIRDKLVEWYPMLEENEILTDVSLDKQFQWFIDKQWFTRILDNLFQNVIRHAKDGRYLLVKTDEKNAYERLIIKDKGPGMAADSENRGANIGFTIVKEMTSQMGLELTVHSSNEGTEIHILKKEGI